MAEPYLGEIRIVSWPFAPTGWALCDGTLMSISQNAALFSLLGTTYGGDGQTNFALPDFRGRTPLQFGNGVAFGEKGGEATHTLQISEIPRHQHFLTATSQDATQNSISGNTQTPSTPAVANLDIYSTDQPNATFVADAVGVAGGSQPHENMQPYLVVNFIIALYGLFPPHN